MFRKLSSFINRFYSVDIKNMSDEESLNWQIKKSAAGSLIYAIIVVALLTVISSPKGVQSILANLIIFWFLFFLLFAMVGISITTKSTKRRKQGEKRAQQLIENLESIGLNVKRSGSRVAIIDPAERITISFVPTSLYIEEADQGEEE